MKTKKEIQKEFETLEKNKNQLTEQLNKVQIQQFKLQGQFELLDEEEKSSKEKEPKKA